MNRFEKMNDTVPFAWTLIAFIVAVVIVLVHAKLTGTFNWESISYYAPAIILAGGGFDVKMNFKVKNSKIAQLQALNASLQKEVELLKENNK